MDNCTSEVVGSSLNIVNDEFQYYSFFPESNHELARVRSNILNKESRRNSCSDLMQFQADSQRKRQRTENYAVDINSIQSEFIKSDGFSDTQKSEFITLLNGIFDRKFDKFRTDLNADFDEKLKKLDDRLINCEKNMVDVISKIDSVKKENNELRAENSTLRKEIGLLSDIAKGHQMFLENVDANMRKDKLVVLGVSEFEQLNGKATDDEKLLHIFEKMGVPCSLDEISIKRLGEEHSAGDTISTGSGVILPKIRPILLTFKSSILRENLLKNTKKLKEAGGVYEKIFIKKDMHKMVRKEWGRLHGSYNDELKKPSNNGHTIKLDPKKRVVTRDGLVIDSWRMNFL